MNTASVGFHCPECFKAGSQKVRTGAAMFHRRPAVTQTLIAINVLVFLVGAAMGDGVMGGIDRDGLLVRGSLHAGFIAESNDWYRVFTSGFLHYGLLHLAFNMYALWILGPQSERSLGGLRFGLVYAVALVGGSLGALIDAPLVLTAGASGAIYGMFGLTAVNMRSLGISVWESGLGPILLLNFFLTFRVSGISVGGHVGGFIAGLAAGWLVYELPRRARLPKRFQEAVLVAALVAGLVASLAVSNAAIS
jgi:membrane associated rhomboid family serine protease